MDRAKMSFCDTCLQLQTVPAVDQHNTIDGYCEGWWRVVSDVEAAQLVRAQMEEREASKLPIFWYDGWQASP